MRSVSKVLLLVLVLALAMSLGVGRPTRAAEPVIASDDYPYLTWAGAHTTGRPLGKLADRDYPLTWEARASQADYQGMRIVSTAFVDATLCAPHTWHAAEAFLLLHDQPR